jgi:hypothetical protein
MNRKESLFICKLNDHVFSRVAPLEEAMADADTAAGDIESTTFALVSYYMK